MQLRKAKPPESGTKCLGDGGGLRLLVTANGNKRWQMEYVSPVTHKRRLAGFGTYYDNGGGVSLTEAREKRDEFRRMIRKGLDPLDEQEKEAAARRREKEAQEALQQTFRKTAEEWFDVRTREFSDRTRNAIYRAIQYLTPHIGNIPLAKLRITDVSKALEPLFDRVETCHRVAGIAHRICRYGATKGYVEGDFLSALPDVLPKKPSVAHHAAITDPAEFGRLLLALDEYRGDISTVYCLRMLPYVFVRSSDIRNARWSEIDLKARMWTNPAARMKMKREHVVPLAH
ncbi:MAG: integrase arm-type DNA-binding domain-containing protein, partial [Deltaproteobacteria bacterium]|nr:integrase arm-type DNA-binding domain-containing protein [Deltaproteobacteria bacterium]